MLKLNRKTEYALLALRYMSTRDDGTVTSVREIAEHYNIPEMLLAKVLQRLKHGAVVRSVKGSSGGYALSGPPRGIYLTDVLSLFNEQTHLVDCIDTADPCACQQGDHCDIREPVRALNALILGHLRGLDLQAFFAGDMGSAKPRRLSIYRGGVATGTEDTGS
ncbi:MAG: RrF2 family transcriptional regulator [Myxococcota bacterium]